MTIQRPRQLGIIIFGNYPLPACLKPARSIIKQSVHELDRAAIRTPIDLIEKGAGKQVPVHQTLLRNR